MLTTLALVATLSAEPTATPIRDAGRAIPVETFIAVQPAPDDRAMNDWHLGTAIVSISAAAIANSFTAVCAYRDDLCRELNPVMDRWLKTNRIGAVIGKAAIGGALHYVLLRVPMPSKMRQIALSALAGLNVWDAVHDIRVMRQIEAAR